jgi:hypothetical protein
MTSFFNKLFRKNKVEDVDVDNLREKKIEEKFPWKVSLLK